MRHAQVLAVFNIMSYTPFSNGSANIKRVSLEQLLETREVEEILSSRGPQCVQVLIPNPVS